MTANPFDFYRYMPISRQDRDWGLYVTAGGKQTNGDGATRDRHPVGYEYHWNKGRVFADQFSIMCLTEGAPYEFETEATGVLTVEVGDVFLLFPQVWHRYRCNSGVRHTHVWAVFGGSQAEHLLRRKVFSPEQPVLKVGMHESVLQPFRRMLGLLETAPLGLQQKLGSCVLDALGSSIAAHHADPGTEAFGDVVRQAIAFLEEQAECEVDLEALAGRLHLSYDQFRHVFKQRTGLPPYQYHLQLRMSRARELLAGSALSVKQISFRLGFTDPYHFSRIFKRKTGFAPQDWREKSARPRRS